MKGSLLILLLTVSIARGGCCGTRVFPSATENDSTDAFREILRRQFISNCEPDIVLTDIENHVNYLYWAANSIRVSNHYRIIGNSGSDITMKAGKVIVLKPRTAVLKGNRYLARIEPCSPDCPSAEGFVVPKGISPNNDGYNDSFDLSELCVRSLKIFNRYGLLVYGAQDYEDEWRGQSDKGDLPSSTYFYVITLISGQQITGWVYLQKE